MSLPYFPMFPTDFEADTSHLTMAEDGAYNRLLRLCWMTPGCSIPADETWVMRRARAFTEADKEAVRSVLAEFFSVDDGRYSNARLTRIFTEANEAHEKRKNAGSKGGKAKALKTKDTGSGNAKAMPKQPEPEPEPYKIDDDTQAGSPKELLERILKAAGIDWTKDISGKWFSSEAIHTVNQFRSLNLTDDEIVGVVREVSRRSRNIPGSLNYFMKPMQKEAGRKTEPPPQPIAPTAQVHNIGSYFDKMSEEDEKRIFG